MVVPAVPSEGVMVPLVQGDESSLIGEGAMELAEGAIREDEEMAFEESGGMTSDLTSVDGETQESTLSGRSSTSS